MPGNSYWVYIVASGPCGWLYVGMTNDLIRRIGEHRHGQIDGYSRERGTDQLVWHEPHRYVDQAILREKRIKRWLRPWKFALVEENNPDWTDLYGDLVAGAARPGSPLRCGRDDKDLTPNPCDRF
ncbi:MAG: GIY-YIG nuclease family protein [Brevundimonas sp.]|uniref:GIY-YIG nuclease family protein n=1 Tax=Brevundimonas sp. TaxID=1871086 RepID=UPI00273267C1|nr:GIY-YIG nuclease family protein [Brevundimonas sp.]MDP3406084.1 GIY-YIG nuclease family protein [Brevundimonas sp.]